MATSFGSPDENFLGEIDELFTPWKTDFDADAMEVLEDDPSDHEQSLGGMTSEFEQSCEDDGADKDYEEAVTVNTCVRLHMRVK